VQVTQNKTFSKVYIEISNLCNLQCSFCPEVKRGKKILSVKEFKKIITEVTPFTDNITLHLMGEPLLHPSFQDILEIINSSSLRLDLTTNGILLKKHKDLLLQSKAIRQINFSVQSYLDNFPDRGIEDYLQLILDFTRSSQVVRPDMFINFRLWNLLTETKIPDEVHDLLQRFALVFHSELPHTLDVRSKKSWKLTDKVRIHWDTRFEWPSLQNKNYGPHGYCYGLKSHIGIHADGQVVPCCLDKEANINLGNIFDSSLKEILDTDRAQSIIKNFEQRKVIEELCQKCSFKDRFSKKNLIKVSK
jgi:radical SAM protein with 4Fe4S-binding SPASM domain